MRRFFLWMADNRWLRTRLPQLWFARRAVRKFMPGETLDDALAAGAAYERAGVVPMYTRLGEHVVEMGEADAAAAHYLGALDRIAAGHSKGAASVQATPAGLDLEP